MLSRISSSTLFQVALGGLVMGTVGLYSAHKYVQIKVRRLPHYKQALLMVMQNRTAQEELGVPINLGTVDLSDRVNNYVDHVKMRSRLRIPVSGTLNSGFLDVKAIKSSPVEDFQAIHVELLLPNSNITLLDKE